MQGLIGKKVGMTQVYTENGVQVPVTVIEVGPCVVVQRKIADRDGYEAVQVGFADQKEQRVNKPELGHFKRAGVTPFRHLHEFRVDAANEAKEGDTLTVEHFEDAKYVDIVGVTKGRGFQGVVKRHDMSGGRASHGSSMHRRVGSIGMNTKPAKVHKNRRMPGQMGNTRITVQNIEVVQVRKEDNALLVKGAVPGPNGGVVYVSKAIKKG